MRSQRRGSVHSILNTALYATILLGAMSFMLNSMMLLPTPIGIVTSRSMLPTMDAGDIVFIEPIAIEDVKVGNIIAFYQPPDEKTVIHRVTRVIQSGKIYLRTKGDNNPVEDQEVGGWIGVDRRKLIGRVYCLDGQPHRIPLIGLLVIAAKNFSIWLTQNKVWAFWAPMLAVIFVFGPYLSPGGLAQFDFRRSLRIKIPTKPLFAYSLIAMCAISLFTVYFRTEFYTLTMRVSSLEEPWRGYIYYGSMVYGEVRNNSLTVSGAPLFPVKTFVWITGNASLLVKPIPNATKIEPNTLNDLILQANIPARGEVAPGPYDGMVYIFSDTVLLFLSDQVIFAVLSLIPNPWVAVALLDVLMALILASLLMFTAFTINWASRQLLYSLVWRDKLRPNPLSLFRKRMHAFRVRVGAVFQVIGDRAGSLYSVLRREVELKGMLKLTGLAVFPAAILFLLRDNVLLPIMSLGLALGVLARRKERSEMVFGGALANLFFSVIFIVRRGVIFLYSTVNPYWSLVSAGFVGNVSYMTTLPIAVCITLISAIGIEFARIWYLEQQTSSWQTFKPMEITIEKTIKIPSLIEVERRRLFFSDVRGVSVSEKVKGILVNISRKIGRLLKTLRLEAHIVTLFLKGLEAKFIGMEASFITLINGIRSKAKSVKSRITRLMENAWLMLRLLSYKIIHTVNRGGFL